MDRLIELGFVCQLVFKYGDVVSTSIRDARTGELLYSGKKEQDLSDALMDCVSAFSKRANTQKTAMDNA